MKEASDGGPRWTASPVTLHAVQCSRCLKWRIIPTKEQYETIREHILENPWYCESASHWRAELRCDLPADIEQDRNMLWAIDKPNLPAAPTGWERQITVRTDGSSKFADVYYASPLGTKLRSKVEIEKYIAKHPESVPPETTMDQFSFAIPRPLPGVCPQLTQAGAKLATSQTPQEEHYEEGQGTAEPANKVSNGDAQAPLSHSSTYPSPSEQGSAVSADENAPQSPPVPQISRQRMELRPQQPSKRRNPDLPPTTRRTKQQVKSDRLKRDSAVFPASDQQRPDASAFSVTTESSITTD